MPWDMGSAFPHSRAAPCSTGPLFPTSPPPFSLFLLKKCDNYGRFHGNKRASPALMCLIGSSRQRPSRVMGHTPAGLARVQGACKQCAGAAPQNATVGHLQSRVGAAPAPGGDEEEEEEGSGRRGGRFPRQPPRLQGNTGRRCQREARMLRGGTGLGGTSALRRHRGTQGYLVPTTAGRGETHFWGDKGAVPRTTQQPHSPSQRPLPEGRGHQPTSPMQQPPRCSGSSKMGSGQHCLHTLPRAQPSQHSTPRARSHPHAAVHPRATHTCAHVCTPLGHSCNPQRWCEPGVNVRDTRFHTHMYSYTAAHPAPPIAACTLSHP